MPYTVPFSFNLFRKTSVDLDSEQASRARNSRDYLQNRISSFPDADADFPRLYRIAGRYQYFGSFARKTKVQPLDDVDILVVLNGKGTASTHSAGYTHWLRLDDSTSRLRHYLDGYGYVNSTKILNKLKSALKSIAVYRSAELNRRGEAVVLNLISYDWSFDLVPAFAVRDGSDGVAYYLIPDGKGEWKRTDPRLDQAAVTQANQWQDGNLIPLIRTMKYWNFRGRSAPRIGSYHLEAILIDGFSYGIPKISTLRCSIPDAFRILARKIMVACPDPKRLGPNLDADLEEGTRTRVRDAAQAMAAQARLALKAEEEEDNRTAIERWCKVFPDFPRYGENSGT